MCRVDRENEPKMQLANPEPGAADPVGWAERSEAQQAGVVQGAPRVGLRCARPNLHIHRLFSARQRRHALSIPPADQGRRVLQAHWGG